MCQSAESRLPLWRLCCRRQSCLAVAYRVPKSEDCSDDAGRHSIFRYNSDSISKKSSPADLEAAHIPGQHEETTTCLDSAAHL